MKLETILSAAVSSMIRGHHAPHCFTAHVPGRGYVNDGSNTLGFDRADYLRQLERAAQSEIENLGFADHYSEPGYSDPEKGIVWVNWNCLPRGLDRILERAGYAVEWSDEWSTCDDCGGAVRTQPDSYSWECSYVETDGAIVCHKCVDWEDYCRSIEDDATKAVTSDVDPAEFGYVRLSNAAAFENGFHPGQTDDPVKILAECEAAGKKHVLFRVSGVGQFDVTFETWIRESDDDDAEG